MAIYKIVDAEKLDADLKGVADKIREKSNTADKFEFSQDFIDAVDTLPSSDGSNKLAQVVDRSVTELTAGDLDGATSIGYQMFQNFSFLTSVAIPNSVLTINDYAFRGCTALTDITFSDSVVSIGGSAFLGCKSLVNLTISDSVKSIGTNAFDGCTNLTNITIGNGVTNIDGDAFADCRGLTKIVIPNCVTNIGYRTFQNCTGLINIELPDSLIEIGSDAFDNTAYYNDESNWENDVLYIGNHLIQSKTNISGKYVIQDGVVCIADSAFENCKSLTSVTIPSSVVSMNEDAFLYCSALTSVHITDITSWCNIIFENRQANPLCYAKNLYVNEELVTELIIPDNVTSIRYNAFCNCDSLTSVTIGNHVVDIGSYAFNNCSSLVSIIVPASVMSIGNGAFNYCTLLQSCDFTEHTSIPTLSSVDAFSAVPSTCEIRVPLSLVDEWKAATNWSAYADQIIGV